MSLLMDDTMSDVRSVMGRLANTCRELPSRSARNPRRTLSRELCPRLSGWALFGLGVVIVIGVALGVHQVVLQRTTSWFGQE